MLKVIFAGRRIAQRQDSFRVMHTREKNVRNSAQLPRNGIVQTLFAEAMHLD